MLVESLKPELHYSLLFYFSECKIQTIQNSLCQWYVRILYNTNSGVLIAKCRDLHIVACQRGGVSNKPPWAPGSDKTRGQGSLPVQIYLSNNYLPKIDTLLACERGRATALAFSPGHDKRTVHLTLFY